MEPIACPETSVLNQSTMRNNTEHWRIQINRIASLRRRQAEVFIYSIYFLNIKINFQLREQSKLNIKPINDPYFKFGIDIYYDILSS